MSELEQALERVLIEIEKLLLDTHGNPNRFTDEAFRAAAYTFFSATMDKMWALQQKEKMPKADIEAMFKSCGNDLKGFVRRYTGIDTIELFSKR